MVKYKYIIEAIEKSYSHKPHLGELPYDLKTNDIGKLKERLKACNDKLKETEAELKEAIHGDKEMDKYIKEIEDNEKDLNERISEMEKENAEINETVKNIHDHFEDVTMMTEEDGWEIKKQYDKVKESSDKNDIKDIDENMKEFIDEVSLLGYIPDTYPKNDSISAKNYIDEKMNPMIDNLKKIDTPEAKKLVSQLEDYRDKYDIGKDTPLTQKLNRIEENGNISDTWYITTERNNKEIKEINEKIEKENQRKDQIIENKKENNKDRRKLETKVNDYKEHGKKIQDKINELGG